MGVYIQYNIQMNGGKHTSIIKAANGILLAFL